MVKQAIERKRLQHSLNQLLQSAYVSLAALQCDMWHTREPVPFAQRKSGKYRKLNVGDVWAQEVFDCAWMHVTGQLPADICHDDPDLRFLVDVAGEGLIVSPAGEELQGITLCKSVTNIFTGDMGKRVVLPRGGIVDETGKVEFWIDAAANDLFGNRHATKFHRFALRQLHVARVDETKRKLYYDCAVLLGIYDANPKSSYSQDVFAAVQKAVASGDGGGLQVYLATKNDDPNAFEYSAQGHSHLDLAWLWPIRETKRKGARTFASQMMNLERYPDYVFGASQAQLYLWMKEQYPDIYAKVKALHQQGRWDIQGANWVEPDSNLINGESLIRQFYYGKKFFREEFGVDPRVLWLVDSFGYSACWPQVMQLADVPYFLTQKLSWNTVNTFPYHTYHWQGLDGGEPVLAHMLPEDTYNAAASPHQLTKGEKRYKERKVSRRAASLFGIGDGGGGPGFEHLERAQRMANVKGLPKYTQESTEALFDKLAAEDNDNYATHQGELYLEKHQGCYTTQSRTKRYNRKCEFLLRNYELLAAQAKKEELPISKEELDVLWQEVLLYQFHDILPGSSISRVYEECEARYAIIVRQLQSGIAKLAEQLYGGNAAVNLNSHAYKGVMKANGAWRYVEIPAFGAVNLDKAPLVADFHAKSRKQVIENDCARVVFHDGVIVSYIHKQAGREIAKGPLNVFNLYTDIGDCWDIHPHAYYKMPHQTAKCTQFYTISSGARTCAVVEFKVGGTVIQQEIYLTDGSPLLRFRTKIQHRGKHCMLRVGFNLPMGDKASFNIPYGHIERATTENNKIEKAQYEVSGQKFVDLTDGDYGVTLINDSKYGFRCKNGYLDINLLRSPRGGPGKNVDQGAHELEYALYPHEGPLDSDVYAQAYFLNNPILRTGEGKAKKAVPLVRTTNENIVVEHVKIADDGNGLLLRIYNSSAQPQCGEVRVAGHKPKCYTGVMEDDDRGAATEQVELRGFELKIVRYV